MSQYEERYPDSYGRGEATDRRRPYRRFFGLGLPRQVRDPAPLRVEPRRAPQPAERPVERHVERPRRPLVERSPREICEDVTAELKASPFIDSSGIVVTVNGGEVTLDGTINSLIAISLAQALASNVPGVSRVQTWLRVRQAPRAWER
jgi:hypothetical protein